MKLQAFSENVPETKTGKNRMDKSLENLFPGNLYRAVLDHCGRQTIGVALLRQPAVGSGPGPILLDPSAAGLLHPHETAQAGAYKLAKRRAEYVAGRICAKLALAGFWAANGDRPAPSAVAIVNGSTGRPIVRFATNSESKNQPPPEISITHGGAYGAALATAAPCGIDLQEQKDTLLRVKDKYCTADEYRLLQACLPGMEPTSLLSLLWAAKEAAKKALSGWWMPGFLELRLTRPELKQAGCLALPLTVRSPEAHRLPEKITVLATTFDRYGLAVCILQEDRAYAGITGS